MALDFPESPVVDDEYTIGNKTYIWDGVAWNLKPIAAPASSGGSVDLVASGVVTAGNPCILNIDGTVTVISSSDTVISEDLIVAGSEIAFGTNFVYGKAAVDPFDDNRFAVLYGTPEPYVVACTVSVDTITFGTPVALAANGTDDVSENCSISFDPGNENTLLVSYKTYQFGYDDPRCVIITLAGTVCTKGAEYIPEAGNANAVASAFESGGSGKFLSLWSDAENSSILRGVVGTYVGTVITYGTIVNVDTGTTSDVKVVADPFNADKFLVTFYDSVLDQNKVVCVTVSDTTITINTPQNLISAVTGGAQTFTSMSSLVPNKFIAVFPDSNGPVLKAVICDISGTDITVGTPVEISNGSNSIAQSICFDNYQQDTFYITYYDSTNTDNRAVVCTFTGNTITPGTPYIVEATTAENIYCMFGPSSPSKFMRFYKNSTGWATTGQFGVTVVDSNLSSSYIGIASTTAADTEPCTIQLDSSVNTNQTGLTIGTDYYVQKDGTLAATPDTPSIKVGKALSATSILLKGY